ncbi:hypothetical protein ASD8599_00501 [Ascidiaceihabitans donghaensis]|uniref:Nudix hydrolase domain-containing protein n=1 Tax=Ascidiaceihabitans donghaensis TaxID=1510460 RepID=A0A2R8BA54_9RHOB|nr:NUDIX hydrolase [Ascidiaceihabitans donghaensis]SPH19765.1 hypothetical protein ASD8599_00501 [Ascidiaceihabitans donghaensis]
MNMPFHGAKLALFLGDDLAVLLRDDFDHIPFPDHWDLPGGGREGNEVPLGCALRETYEELGLTIAPEDVSWGKRFDGGQGEVWLFVAHLPAGLADGVVFGDEGQRWALMAPDVFVAHPKAVPNFAARLRLYLSGVAGDFYEKPPR